MTRNLNQALALLVVAALSAFSVGCAVGVTGLPQLPNVPTLTITTTTVPAGFDLTAYPPPTGGGTTLSTTGGVPPLSSCTIVSGPVPTGAIAGLPAGLSIGVNPSNRTQCLIAGTISLPAGTPLPATFAFTVRAADSSTPPVLDTQNYTMTVGPAFGFVGAIVLQNGTVGQTYTKILPTTGGNTGSLASCTITAGALPAGLVIGIDPANNRRCRISGMPTVAGTFSGIAITVTDNNNPSQPPPSTQMNLTLIINPDLVVPAFVLGNGTVGRPFTFTVPTTGGNRPLTSCTATFGGTPLPTNGLSIAPNPANTAANANSCIISGTPTAAAAGNVVVTVVDTVSTDPALGGAVVTPADTANSAAVSLTINAALAFVTTTVVDGITSRDYVNSLVTSGGNLPLASCTSAGTLPAGLAVRIDPADTSRCQLFSAGAAITGAGGTFNFSITATDTASATTAAGTAVQAFTLVVRNDYAVIEPNLVDAILGRTYTKAVRTNLVSVAGATDIGQTAENGNGPLAAGSCTDTTGNLATVGLTIAINPADASQCLISGTPTSGAGTTINITIQVTDNIITQAPTGTVVLARTLNVNFTLSIRAEFTITPFTVVDGIMGRTYTNNVVVTTNLSVNATDVGQAAEFGNGPTTNCTVTGLPVGILASCVSGGNSVTMNLTGTPTVAGTSNSTINITDTDILQNAAIVTPRATISLNFALTIRNEFTITEPNLVDAILGRTYTKNIATTVLAVAGASDVGQVAELGNGPLATCTETTGALAGVGLGIGVDPTDASRCRISGTPTAGAGTTINITVRAVDNPIGTVVPAPGITRAYQLTIRAEFAITEPFVVDGINSRQYSKHIDTSLSAAAGASDIGQAAEFGNGPPATCTATLNGTALPTGGLTIATDTNGCLLSTGLGGITQAAGTYALVVSVTDNDILQTAVTVVAARTVSTNFTFRVRTPSTVVTTQLVDAIQNRAYTNFVVTDKTAVATTTTGAGSVTACTFSGTPPTGLAVAVDAAGLDCNLTGTVTGAPGVYSFSVNAVEGDIIQDAVTVVAGTTFSQAFTNFRVRAEYAFLTTSVVDGVEGRAYSKLVETSLSNVAGANDFNQTENGNGPIAGACGVNTTGVVPFPGSITVNGITLSVTVDPAFPNSCRLTATIPAATAAGTQANFFVGTLDNTITQVNARTGATVTVVTFRIVATQQLTLTTRAALAIDQAASNCPGAAAGDCPVAVKGRTYTNTFVRQAGTGGDPAYTFSVAAAGSFTPDASTPPNFTGNTGTPCEAITINGATGAVGGTPAGATTGICLFTLQLDDAGIVQASPNQGINLQVVPATPPGSAQFRFTIDVRPEMTLVNTVFPAGLEDSAYNLTFQVQGGLTGTGQLNLPAVVTWAESGASLGTGACTGLTLTDLSGTTADQRATLTGTTTTAGTCTFNLLLTDNGNAPGTAQFVPNGNVTIPVSIIISQSQVFVTNNAASNARVVDAQTNAAIAGAAGTVMLPPGTPQGLTVHPADPLFGYVANGTTAGGVTSVFCTRVEMPVCPVAFAPPVLGPTFVQFVSGGIQSINPTDVAVANSGTFGVIADPAFGTTFCGGTGAIWYFFADRTSAAFNQQTSDGACIPGALNISLRPQSDFVYVTRSGPFVDRIGVLNGNTISQATIPLPGAVSIDVAVSPDGRFAYVADTTGFVHVLDADPASGSFGTVVASTPAPGAAGGMLAGATPSAIAFAPDGRFVYVTDQANSVVAAIDPATLGGGSVTVTNNSIALTGTGPLGIAVIENSLKAFVANNTNNTVSAVDTDATPSATFQTEIANFDAGNFSAPFGVAAMPNASLHIQNPLPAGIAGASYSFSVVAFGGMRPYTFSAMGLPAGFTMDAAGLITAASGNAATAGNYPVVVTVLDTSVPVQQMATRTINLTIFDAAALAPGGNLLDAIAARTYSGRLNAGGATVPVTFTNPGGGPGTLNAGDAECTGLTLGITGAITGTAGAAGMCDFQAQLVYQGTPVGSPANFTLNIRAEFSVTETLEDLVRDRAYTKHIDTNLLAAAGPSDAGQAGEFGNGPAANCTATLDGGALPAGFAIVSETNGCRLTIAAGSTTALTTGMHAVQVSVTDNPIVLSGSTVVPAGTRLGMLTLFVRNEYSITSASPGTLTATNGAAFNLAFTATTDLSNNPVPTEVNSAENGNGPISSCILMGAVPNGLVPTTTISGGGLSCDVSITGTVSIATVPTNFGLTLMINDTPILEGGAGAQIVGAATAMQLFAINVTTTNTTTAIVSDLPDPSAIGESVTVNFTVTQAAGTQTPTGGTVTVSDGVDSCMGTLTTGTGSCNVMLTTAGMRTLVATYSGSGIFNGSVSAGEPHQVKTVALAAFTLGNGTELQTFTQDIAISGTPAGALSCTDGGTLPASLTVAFNATPNRCTVSGAPDAATAGTFSVTITVNDAGSGDMDAKTSSLVINAALDFANGTTLPDAVEQRTGYSVLIVGVGGEPPLTITEDTANNLALADDGDCNGFTFSSATRLITGTPTVANGVCQFTLIVTGTDTASTVGAFNAVQFTITVQPMLTINDPAPVGNALRGSAYLPTNTPAGQAVSAMGGTGISPAFPLTYSVTAGPFTPDASTPPNFNGTGACVGLTVFATAQATIDEFSTVISGTPTTAGTCSFTVRATDLGSTDMNGDGVGPGFDEQAIDIIILGTFTYVADPANNQVIVIDTTTDTEVDTDSGTGGVQGISLAAIGANRGPHGVAIHRDGTKAYVTLETSNELAVIDTTTNTLILAATVDLSATCTSPRGIAVGNTGNARDRAYIACGSAADNNVDVVEVLDLTGTTPVSVRTIDLNAIAGVDLTNQAGEEPFDVAISPDGSLVFIAVGNEDETFRITTGATPAADTPEAFLNTLQNGGTAADTRHVIVSRDPVTGLNGTFVYYTDLARNTIQVVIAAAPANATTTEIGPLFGGLDPFRLDRDPNSNRVFVGFSATGTLDPQDAATTTGFLMPIEANTSVPTRRITVGNNNADRAGDVTTITFNNHGFAAGDVISVLGMSTANFDGFFTITAATTNTFSYSQTGLADNADEENGVITLVIPAGATAVTGVATPVDNTKVYSGINDNVSRRNDASPFGSAGANIGLSGASAATPAGMAPIRIPLP